MSFGRKLKELRLRADLTQTELAEAVGVDYTYLSKIENDRVEPPSEKVILKLA
ncbi:MAG: helix-turn-helix domain-containing protein [Candidatus Marsarchaeota archaeon]|nr:helix-turn-helix domain-containing protein [Candidatus Marsarchaeota archaeon]